MKVLLLMSFMAVSLMTGAHELKVTTYNLGLAHTFIPYAEERLEPLKEALKNHDADVLCLQEVWEKKDQKKIKKALKKSFPYLHKTKIKNFRQGDRPTCKIKDIFGEGKFVSCMQNKCGGKEGDEFTDCIIDKCGEPLENLKRTNRVCASALMAQVGKSPIASILTLLNPLWRAGLFAYKGSNGLMLFSKYPMVEKDYVDLKTISTLNKRGALQAILDVRGKKVQVMCAHISADLTRTVPYTGTFASWGEENEKQAAWLLQAANHYLYPTIMMGDFNCGFEDPFFGLSPELSSSCKQFKNWGYRDPISEVTRDCTFCQDNLLNEGELESSAIDHIFLKGADSREEAIVFKDVISVERDGVSVQTQLSDHYGYSLKVLLD